MDRRLFCTPDIFFPRAHSCVRILKLELRLIRKVEVEVSFCFHVLMHVISCVLQKPPGNHFGERS